MGVRRIVAVAALAAGLGALAEGAARADDGLGASQPEKAKADTGRKVCRLVIPTGSRMNSRICRTQAEWDRARDKSQQAVLRHQTTEQSGYAH